MGAASSTNVSNETLSAITTIATKMMNNQNVSSLQGQGIIVKNAQSDVIISGNHFNQSITINFEALLKAISTQSAQQDLMQEISQVATSLNKQLNLFQFSDSENIINAYLNATIDLSTNITQACVAVAQQSQTISIDTVGGVVKVTDNTFTQTQSIMSKCLFDSLSNSDALQKVQQATDQSAKATNEGVNIWAIVIMMILGLLMLILPELLPLFIVEKAAADVVKIFLDMFFILMIIAGIVLIACFATMTKNIISLDGDVAPISATPECAGTVAKTTREFKNPADAGSACLHDKYDAYDFRDGETTFYSSVSASCQNILLSKQIKTKPSIVPKITPTIFTNLPNPENFSYKDVIVLLDGKLYYCNLKGDTDEKVWSVVKNADDSEVIYFSLPDPTPDQVQIAYSIPTFWPSETIRVIIYAPPASEPIGTEYRVYTNQTDISKFVSKPPPPLYNYQPNPDLKTTQWTGFNIVVRRLNNVYLWVGLILIIVGFFGVLIQLITRKKSIKKKI